MTLATIPAFGMYVTMMSPLEHQAKVSNVIVELQVAREGFAVTKELGWLARSLRKLRQELQQVDGFLRGVRETKILRCSQVKKAVMRD